MLRSALNMTGPAVLNRMGSDAEPHENVTWELYQSFANRADAETCRSRLGKNRLTHKLLLQRFDEDLTAIAAIDSVTVI